MKYTILCVILSLCIFGAGCDVQSGISKQSVEKYQPTPTPEKAATPTEEPIDPADVVTADTSAPGPRFNVNTAEDRAILNCDKYNKVMVNGSGLKVKITGACSQIMVNGKGNQVDAVAAAEIVAFGSANTITYSKFVNGKKPVINDPNSANTITKVEAESTPAAKK